MIMNSNLVSTHMFLYYESVSKYLLETVSKFYNGPLYLSLVENNCSNDVIINYASANFKQVYLIYVDNRGTDQYGLYHSLKYDNCDHPWIFYCHDKHPDKIDWLKDLIEIYNNIDSNLLLDNNTGIISSLKHKIKSSNYQELFELSQNTPHHCRKGTVQAMHTLVWLDELIKILLEKDNIFKKEFRYTHFTAGNIFLIRRDIIKKVHECVYSEFFNQNAYRTDGDIGHGLERFYYYVSQCLGYNNMFI